MTNAFDAFLYKLINQTLVSKSMDWVMVSFSDKTFWIPFYCVVIWFMARQLGKKTLLVLLFTGLSVLFSDRFTSGLMKPVFKRIRPCHLTELSPRLPEGIYCSDSGSMASSHAANHFAVAIFMILLFRGGKQSRAQVAFWLIWASAISYSRVYCGVHYPTDVLAGAAVGAVFGAACFKLYTMVLKRTQWQ